MHQKGSHSTGWVSMRRGRAWGAAAAPGCSNPETASVQWPQMDRLGKPTAARGEHPTTQPAPAVTGNILNVRASSASIVLAGNRFPV